MKTLTSPITTQAAAEQSAWCEVYDFYLKSAITTPWGTLSILRITDLPGDLAFFTPKVSPEAAGNQGVSQTYKTWVIKREIINASAKYAADKLAIAASNVTEEFSSMLDSVDWEDVPVVIRKVSTTIASPTADDCVLVFSGQIDSARITLQQLTFTCSSDLGSLSTILPRENIHPNCRFNWSDDQCTAIRFLQENYKTKTCASGSTTAIVKSAGLTEDTAAYKYVGVSVTADSTTEKITLTAHNLNNGDLVRFGGTAVPGGLTAGTWYYVISVAANDFQISLTFGGSAINLTTNGTAVTMDSSDLYGPDLVGPLADAAITASSFAGYTNQPVVAGNGGAGLFIALTYHTLASGQRVKFSGTTMPGGITAGTYYYVADAPYNTPAGVYLSNTLHGGLKPYSTAGSGVLLTSEFSDSPFNVKSGYPGLHWSQQNSGTDWGTNSQGYWEITAGQDGLANAALKPWIRFDFGSAKTPRVWRIAPRSTVPREELPRLILFFSSADDATWAFESYYEMPPIAGQYFDILIPKASTKRYWRICVRSRWSESLHYSLFDKVLAFENSRQWWRDGQLTFDSATTTAALRSVTRTVLESHSGQVTVAPLPATPVNTDTFVIERGCPRSFNGCCERKNTENFGGIYDVAQDVLR